VLAIQGPLGPGLMRAKVAQGPGAAVLRSILPRQTAKPLDLSLPLLLNDR